MLHVSLHSMCRSRRLGPGIPREGGRAPCRKVEVDEDLLRSEGEVHPQVGSVIGWPAGISAQRRDPWQEVESADPMRTTRLEDPVEKSLLCMLDFEILKAACQSARRGLRRAPTIQLSVLRSSPEQSLRSHPPSSCLHPAPTVTRWHSHAWRDTSAHLHVVTLSQRQSVHQLLDCGVADGIESVHDVLTLERRLDRAGMT